MAPPTSPAAELQHAVSDVVSAFLKAANHALSTVEEASKDDLRRAVQSGCDTQRERDELRRERDAMLQEKLNAVVELETAKRETDRWKAATEKGEWMINHQAETIVQLRREAQQWKDQFMRVDEERLRLSARNDELVSQQLYANRRDAYHQEPMTPRSQGPQALSSSASESVPARARSSSKYVSNGYVADGAASRRASRSQPSTSQALAPKSARQGQASASTSRPLSQPVSASSSKATVLRRVHVVMKPPVKEESIDSTRLVPSEKAARSTSLGEEEEVASPMQTIVIRSRAAMPRQTKSTRRRWSEDKRIYDDDESDESGPESDGDEDEDEYVPPSRSRAGDDDDDDDDDDELMLGGEDNRAEIYGTEKVIVKETRNPPARRAQTQTGTATARKRNSPYRPNANGTGKKARRR